MYYVYILKSIKNGSLYIGYSENIKNRIDYHNSGHQKSTKKGIPHMLIWFCVFPNKKAALKLEKYLKSGSGHAFTKKRLVSHQ